MGSELIIIPVIFGAVFGVFYLYFSTRNKERLEILLLLLKAKLLPWDRRPLPNASVNCANSSKKTMKWPDRNAPF